MRHQRSQLSPQQQLQAARNLSQIVFTQPWFQRAQNIALYLANVERQQAFYEAHTSDDKRVGEDDIQRL